MRIAALDLGSNSFHLLVADVHPDGTFEPLAREKEMLRLGDDVEPRRLGSRPAADAAVADRPPLPAARRRRRRRRRCSPRRTSAIRRAANGGELVDRIEAETGVEVEVISGLEEARLIFRAVRAARRARPGPRCASTSAAAASRSWSATPTGLQWATSVPLGVGRLTAEFVRLAIRSRRATGGALREHLVEVLGPLADATW